MANGVNQRDPYFLIRPTVRRRTSIHEGRVEIDLPQELPEEPVKPTTLQLFRLGGGIASLLPIFFYARNLLGIFSDDASGATFTPQSLAILIPLMLLFLLGSAGARYLKYRFDQQQYEKKLADALEKYDSYLREKERDLDNEHQQQRRILAKENPSLPTLVKRVRPKSTDMWNRFPNDSDFLSVRIGTGAIPSKTEILFREDRISGDKNHPIYDKARKLRSRFRTVNDMPILVDLDRIGALGVTAAQSEESRKLVYNILGQVATQHAPDLVKVYLVSFRREGERFWHWMRWLPHTNGIYGYQAELPHFAYQPEEAKELLDSLINEIDPSRHKATGVWAGLNTQPHVIIIFDRTPALFQHPLVRIMQNHNPEEVNSRQMVGIFVDNMPPQVNAQIKLQKGEFDYWETWSDAANQHNRRGGGEFYSSRDLEQLSRIMCPLYTEGVTREGVGELPREVKLITLLGAEKADEINLKSRYAPDYHAKRVMSFPIGINTQGDVQEVILREDGQGGFGHHALLAGATGKGKSVTLQSMVLGLAASHPPTHLNFVLADFKGGASELARIRDLPHVVGFVTDLDEAYIERLRLALEGEILRRKRLLDESNLYQNIYAYNKANPHDLMPHLVVVIDEFAKAMEVNQDFKRTMDKDIAAQGRALGVHLILSTQKAADFAGIPQNIEVRLSMQLNSTDDSRQIFGRDDAAKRLTRAGQAFIQVENRFFEKFQVARSDQTHVPSELQGTTAQDEQEYAITQLALDGSRRVLYEHIPARRSSADVERASLRSEAAVMVDHIARYCRPLYPASRTISLPPLPAADQIPLLPLLSRYRTDDLWIDQDNSQIKPEDRWLNIPLGQLDFPLEQRQAPFFVDLKEADGNYVVAGPAGSGNMLFLQSLLLGLSHTHHPSELGIYILDRTSLSAMESLPHCRGYIRPGEDERIERLIGFLQKENERRIDLLRQANLSSLAAYRQQYQDESLPAIVVVLTDLTSLMGERQDRLTDWLNLFSTAKDADFHFVVSTRSWNQISTRLQPFLQNRLPLGVEHGSELFDIFNRRGKPLPEIEGRGYTLVDQTLIEVQIAAPIAEAGDLAFGDAVRRFVDSLGEAVGSAAEADAGLPYIEVLPTFVSLTEIWDRARASNWEAPSEWSTAPIGLRYSDLAPIGLDFEDLDAYNLVVGPNDAGKTYFLFSLVVSIAAGMSSDIVDILILTLSRNNPLGGLSQLPHVQYAARQSDIEERLTQCRDELKEMLETLNNSSDLAGESLPPGGKIKVILIDGLSRLHQSDAINSLIDECMAYANDLPVFLFLADLGNNVLQARSKYGVKYVQQACNRASGILLSSEQNDLNLLQVSAKMGTATVKSFADMIGSGRGYWTMLETDVVQVGYPGMGGKQRDEDEDLKGIVSHVKTGKGVMYG